MLAFIRNRFHPLWRLRQLAWYRALQKFLDFPVSVRTGRIRYWVMVLRDFSFLVPHTCGEGITHEIFEKIIRRLNVGHLFDVGANVGSFAWHALEIDPGLPVHLFEPDRTNIRLLKKTIRRNRMTNVLLWEGVVADSTVPRQFLVDEASGATGGIKDHTANASSLQAAYGLSRWVSVPSTTLDAHLGAVGTTKRVLVKIDVEGAEREVLLGAKAFTEKLRPVFIIECLNLANLSPLLGAGYTAYSLPENGNYLVLPRELEAVCGDIVSRTGGPVSARVD